MLQLCFALLLEKQKGLGKYKWLPRAGYIVLWGTATVAVCNLQFTAMEISICGPLLLWIEYAMREKREKELKISHCIVLAVSM